MLITIRPWSRYLLFHLLILIVASALSACGSPGGTVAVVAVGNVTRNNAPALSSTVVSIAIPRHSPASGRSALASLPPATVRVLPFNDDRKDLDAEGQVSAALGVPMGRVRFEPSPATVLGRVISSEIGSAGHLVRDSLDAAQITGAVVEFDTRTVTTLLYWDVIGSLAVSLQISGAREAQPAAVLDYRVRCSERTYVWATEAVIAATMNKCVNDFANQVRNDVRVVNALRSAATADHGRPVDLSRNIAVPPRGAMPKSYTPSNQRWSLIYPEAWTLTDTGGYVKLVRGQAVLGIHMLANVAGESLDEAADAAIKQWEQQMQKVNTFRRVSRQRVSLAGDQTAIAIVHHIGTGRVGKSQKIIAVIGGQTYLIDAETPLGAWNDYEGEFNQIIASFRALN